MIIFKLSAYNLFHNYSSGIVRHLSEPAFENSAGIEEYSLRKAIDCAFIKEAICFDCLALPVVAD